MVKPIRSIVSGRARRRPTAAFAALLAASALLAAGSASADVVRDGRVGSAGPGAVATEVGSGGGLRYLIRESDGERAGQNLFHSFSRMNLTSNETAVYQGDPDAGIRNLVTTITDGRSSIDGRIQSTIPGANLYLINPDGIVFGENATVDLSGALSVSTAHQLIFSDDSVMATSGAPPAILSVADPVGFGFLEAPAPISVEGSRIRLRTDQPLSLVAGDIELVGRRSDGQFAVLATRGGRLDLVSLASAGQVIRESDGVKIVGAPSFGDISIVDEMVVTTSGLDPNPFSGLFTVPGFGSGAIFVKADDLLIRDGELRSLTVTVHAASDIDIDLTGDLTVESATGDAQTSIIADSGYRKPPGPGEVVTSSQLPLLLLDTETGEFIAEIQVDNCGFAPCAIRYVLNGDAGDVRIRAQNVRLLNGGKITARSEFNGDAGVIDIRFEDEMLVAGRRSPGDTSLVTTSSEGTGNPGSINIRSDEGALRLDDFGALVIQNGAQSLEGSLPGQILVDVAEIEMSGNARIDSSTRGEGPGGILDITGRKSISLEGRTSDEVFTGISTLSQPGSTGQAGSIRVATANLLMTDGAEIAARPADPTSLGAAGSLRFEIGDQLVMQDATISTESPNAAGGNIELGVGGLVKMKNSSITTSVTSGGEDAGNITLRPGPDALVLDHSRIIAGAKAGDGGRIDIEAGVVITDPSSEIRAPSETGIDGPVLINGVEGNVVPEVAQLATPSVDASSFVREPCAARRPGASNRFVIEEQARIAVAADDYLAAPVSGLLAHGGDVHAANGEREAAEVASEADIQVADRTPTSGSLRSSCLF